MSCGIDSQQSGSVDSHQLTHNAVIHATVWQIWLGTFSATQEMSQITLRNLLLLNTLNYHFCQLQFLHKLQQIHVIQNMSFHCECDFVSYNLETSVF
jgi:hypothetical protein